MYIWEDGSAETSERPMKFEVLDKTTGEVADLTAIEKEQWVKDAGLFRVYRADWMLSEDGYLYLCDPCDQLVAVDQGRFKVQVVQEVE